MAFKFYYSWKNMVNRKQRSLDDEKRYLEVSKEKLEKAKQKESEGTDTYLMGSKYYEKNVKSSSKKIDRLEAELKVIMENIPEDVQSEINEREEIFSTFAEFISFLEKAWNDRDEMLKKVCEEWLDVEIKELKKSASEISEKKLYEFREMEKKEGHKSWNEVRRFMDKVELETYIIPRNELLKKGGFHELSEYEKISSNTIESLRKKNLEDAQQSVINLIERVEGKVGKVNDWSNLHFGMNGMLNGRVTGNLGSVYVETIGAGGYNIQRFHYRVLLKK